MSEDTEHRDVVITVNELRAATLEITEKLHASAMLQAMPNEQLPLVHAYLLGCVIRAVGIKRASISTVLQFVELGYEDYSAHFMPAGD